MREQKVLKHPQALFECGHGDWGRRKGEARRHLDCATELASAPGHPFYQRLNELLEAEKFDEFVEGRCGKFYAAKQERPSLTPGIYFRMNHRLLWRGNERSRQEWPIKFDLGWQPRDCLRAASRSST